MQSAESRRIVCIGDEAVGKTSLLLKYVKNTYSDIYNPTVEETYVLENEQDTEFIDTAGAEAFDRLRPFSYTGATGAIVCFALSNPKTLKEVEEKWVPELKYFCGDIPFFVVGLKKDLRDSYALQPIDSVVNGAKPSFISASQGQELAQRVGAIKYVECSARTGENVADIFIDFSRPALPRFTTRFNDTTDTDEYPYDENMPLPPKTRKQSLAPPKKPKTGLATKPSMPKLSSYGRTDLTDKKRVTPPVKTKSTDSNVPTKKSQLETPKISTVRRGSVAPIKSTVRRPGTPSSTGSNDDRSISSVKVSTKPVRRGSVLPSPPASPVNSSPINSLKLYQRRDSTPALKVTTSSLTSKPQTLSPQKSPVRMRSKSIATPTLLPPAEAAKLQRKKSVSGPKTVKASSKPAEKRLVKVTA